MGPDGPPSTDRLPPLRVYTWGEGPPVLLIHGSVLAGRPTWAPLRGLSEHRLLLVPNRRGYLPGPPAAEESHDVDVRDMTSIARDAGKPVHVIGHSRGAAVALGLARARPDLVRSLVLLEPPALGSNAAVSDAVRRWRADFRRLQEATYASKRDVLAAFFTFIGADTPIPRVLPAALEVHLELLLRSQPPWLWSDQLLTGRASRPTMVISGGHSAAFEDAADRLAEHLGARRELLCGHGHLVQHHPRAPALIEEFLSAGER